MEQACGDRRNRPAPIGVGRLLRLKEQIMAIAETPLIERVARVLAALAHGNNADGSAHSAAGMVDMV